MKHGRVLKFAPGRFLKLSVGVFITTIFLYGQVEAHMVGSNPYRRVETLDSEGKYVLEFEVDRSARRITFNVTVATRGYVGFGLSAKGKMSGADIVIGGVLPNGQSYFSDRHAVGNQVPEVDPSQDWDLQEARENRSHTFLSFSRAWDTCDPQDYPIVEDMVTLIWAYSERDDHDDHKGYHYKTRGAYPIHLLNPDYTPPIERDPGSNYPAVINTPYNEDVRVFSWFLPFVMPTSDTTYWCTMQRGPTLPRKHHMIGFNIRFGDEVARRHIHHVIIGKCRAPIGFSDRSLFERHVGQGQLCYGSGGRSNSVQVAVSGPIPGEYCSDYLYVTAVGDRINFMPPQVGTPFGEDPEEYYLIQVHYDNPNMSTGVRTDATIDIFYTPQLREKEGDFFVVRHESPGLPASELIPPSSIAQKSFATCGSDCSRKIIPDEGIYIYGLLLHAHNSRVGLRFRQFRNNKELPFIAREDNFSPFYQQTVMLPREVHILPGDQLVIECTGDNTWTNGTVVGGFSTRQEMCAAWFLYHTRVPNRALCASEIDSPEFRESFFGIQNITWSTPHLEYVVTAPRRLAGLPITQVSDILDWTMERREEFDEFLLTHPHTNRCPVELYARSHSIDENGEPVDLEPEENTGQLTSLPTNAIPYNPPPTCAAPQGNNNNDNNDFATYKQKIDFRRRSKGKNDSTRGSGRKPVGLNLNKYSP